MPSALQAKLLRVLQDHEVRAVGATQGTPVDVRIISATHRDLDAQMKEGRFREDLYYRLNVVSLDLPLLSERREDIVPSPRTISRSPPRATTRTCTRSLPRRCNCCSPRPAGQR